MGLVGAVIDTAKLQQHPLHPAFPHGAREKAGGRNRAMPPTHRRSGSSGQGAAKGSGKLALGTALLMP